MSGGTEKLTQPIYSLLLTSVLERMRMKVSSWKVPVPLRINQNIGKFWWNKLNSYQHRFLQAPVPKEIFEQNESNAVLSPRKGALSISNSMSI